ncbi:MAG: hypothetical protein LQ347_001557 [Umbilicaria vellea]|nr:MAG: hypothetical protein LQ347_001557 [Umbilicaria vellea]
MSQQTVPRPLIPAPVIPERTSSLLPPKQRSQIAVLKKSNADLKRKVSELSTSSQNSQSEFLDAKVDEINNEDAQLQLLQSGLRESFQDGKLPEADFKSLYNSSFRKRAKLAVEDVTIRRQRQRILDSLAGSDGDLEPDMALAYAAIVTQQFVQTTKNHGLKRTGQQQIEWGNQLRVWYDAVNPDDKKSYWCPISKSYGNRHYRCNAHIVPFSLGTENIEYLFGEPKDTGLDIVWRNENALIIDKGLETAFDKGAFVLIPILTRPDEPTRWKTVLLDNTRRNTVFSAGPHTFNDIDGVELEFKNNNRPGRRYLYYHYCVSILRAVRFQTPGWADAKVKASTGQVWATWGPYLRKSLLLKLGEVLGDTKLPEEFVEAGTFEGDDNVDKEEETIKAKEIMVREVKPKLERWDEDGEDSSDDEEEMPEEDSEESSVEEDFRS